jgi:beta-lactamase regulating signal transducer with metallopeptidase domain
MITLLDKIGPAVWRASWQAAAMALLIALLLRLLGERMPARWRYLLWSVVLARLLFVATPVSPWSMFNLISWQHEETVQRIDHRDADPAIASDLRRQRAGQRETATRTPQVAESAPESPPVRNNTLTPAAGAPSIPTVDAIEPVSARQGVTLPTLIARILLSLWLAGCLLFGLQLSATAFVLRRRLAACRLVSDSAVLRMLETVREQLGMNRAPTLLVSPEPISPCLIGTWNPRIVLPESILTESSPTRLRHVLAHELAHLVRGDLWTNWLLLAARILHWFNPVAWWTVREMQAEREAACDELALAALGESDRSGYATTIMDLAANLAPSTIAPGMIGLFSSSRRLEYRIERLLRSPSIATLRGSVAAGLLLGIGLLGLTDAMPAVGANQLPGEAAPQKEAAPASANKQEPAASTYSIHGRCLDHGDSSALAGIQLRLFKVQGLILPPVEIAQTTSDSEGRFEFTGLAPPRPYAPLERLMYVVFAQVDKRPIAIGGLRPVEGRNQDSIEIRMLRKQATLTGKVINEQGRPVVGATVTTYSMDGRPFRGILSTTTDTSGRFVLDKLMVFESRGAADFGVSFSVIHPDYPETTGTANAPPADVVVTLPKGCIVAGTVMDNVTRKPANGALVTAEPNEPGAQAFAVTDATGHYRIVVREGRYNIRAEAKDRVCVAVADRECLAGEKVEPPALRLIGGGFISGQVVNAATGQPIAISDGGEPITIGLWGPSQPQGRVVISPTPLATVDATGRFTGRAAPGENFPYFVNTHGNRMAWDTQKQPAVLVKEGETTTYNMLITPLISSAEKLKAARKIVAALSTQPSDRTAQIILEFRKLNHTVDETELWCMLMRELVAVGRDAVPQLCAELDRTNEDRMLRRLGFALRAIGDARATPALIRAIPKTLLPCSSDYGLVVNDEELAKFMHEHDLTGSKGSGGGTRFDLGRAQREIFGALHKLTKQDFEDSELNGISLSDDPRRAVLQRRIFLRQAQRWQTWWEAHWKELTDDAVYQLVNLTGVREELPPAPASLGPNARLGEGTIGETLCAVGENGKYAAHFLDLDTGYEPIWPGSIPKDEAQLDQKQLAKWAAENGIDLMCITHHSPDGTSTFVLRAFDMKVWEINRRDLRNIDKLIAAGKLPEGPMVGELLMHYDSDSKKFVPDANAAFIFVTREGNMGLLETTDRITRTADGFGRPGFPPSVGFHKGVRFNLKAIIP